MKNKLTDLNDHLFTQLERLASEDLSSEQITTEIQRTGAMIQVADKIVTNARLQLDVTRLIVEYGDKVKGGLPMIGAGSTEARA